MSLVILAALAVGLVCALIRRMERRRAGAALVRSRLDSICRERELELADARLRSERFQWRAQWSA